MPPLVQGLAPLALTLAAVLAGAWCGYRGDIGHLVLGWAVVLAFTGGVLAGIVVSRALEG